MFANGFASSCSFVGFWIYPNAYRFFPLLFLSFISVASFSAFDDKVVLFEHTSGCATMDGFRGMVEGFSPEVNCIGVVSEVTVLALGFGASVSYFTSSLCSSLLLLSCKTATSEMFSLGKLLTSSFYAAGSASCLIGDCMFIT